MLCGDFPVPDPEWISTYALTMGRNLRRKFAEKKSERGFFPYAHLVCANP